MKKWQIYKIKLSLAILGFLILFGIAGYIYFQGFSFLDATYMTVITISTVGFKEVETLNQSTRIFTIVLIILSFISVAVVGGMLTEIVIAQFSSSQFKKRKMKKQIQQLEKHSIVAGFGLTGEKVINRLNEESKDFVIIEQDKERIQYLQNETNYKYVEGDATQDENLIQAGIEKASSFITTLPSDQANLFAVLSARQLNKKAIIVARLVHTSAHQKLSIAGANQVVMLEKLGGDYLASLVLSPDVQDFLEEISFSNGSIRNIKELGFRELCPNEDVKNIAEWDRFKKTGCKIIGYKNENNQLLINPDTNHVFRKDSRLFILGNTEQIKNLETEFNFAI